MANLRMYREFYVINTNSSSSVDDYSLLDPFELFSDVRIENNNNIVESPDVIKGSLGKYYVDLNPNLYSIDNIYEIIWNVIYVENSPLKKLKTKFKLYPIVIGDNVELRISTNNIDLDLDNTEIRLEI